MSGQLRGPSGRTVIWRESLGLSGGSVVEWKELESRAWWACPWMLALGSEVTRLRRFTGWMQTCQEQVNWRCPPLGQQVLCLSSAYCMPGIQTIAVGPEPKPSRGGTQTSRSINVTRVTSQLSSSDAGWGGGVSLGRVSRGWQTAGTQRRDACKCSLPDRMRAVRGACQGACPEGRGRRALRGLGLPRTGGGCRSSCVKMRTV